MLSIIAEHLPDFTPGGKPRKLEGGNLNHVWRLCGEKGSLIIKHAPPHIASNPDVPLSPDRIGFEAKALNLFHKAGLLHSIASDRIRPPKFFHYDRELNVLIMEDVGKLPGLDRWLTENSSHMKVGVALGRFIGQLHKSTFQHPVLQKKFNNKDIQKTRQQVQYCPAWEYAEKAGVTNAKLIKTRTKDLGQLLLKPGYCLVMGDLWPPSVLVDKGKLRIIDWEFAHYGHPLQDIGHFAAHCWMQAHATANKKHAKQFRTLWLTFWKKYQQILGATFTELFDKRELQYMTIHIGAELLVRSTGPFQAGYIYEGLSPHHALIQNAVKAACSLIRGKEFNWFSL